MNQTLKTFFFKYIPGSLLQQSYRLQAVNAIQVDELKLIYVPIPKVANRSVKAAIAEKIDLPYNISSHRANWQTIPVKEVANHPYHSFSIVRNPLDRLVSCYVQKFEMKPAPEIFWKYGNLIRPDMSFREFAQLVCETPDKISDRHFKSQFQFIRPYHQLIVDELLKFEALQSDWQLLKDKFGLPNIPHSNKSLRKNTADYYSKDLANKVAQRFATDIKVFGYTEDIEKLITQL